MARKATPSKPTPSSSSQSPPPPRERIVDALMALAAENPWSEISLVMITEKAGVSLADLRDAFPSKGAILGGFAKRIDRIVLEGADADMTGEPVRERVLDIMLRRLDALTPYRKALRSIRAGMMLDPLGLAALNQVALNSWRFMLASAGVDTEDDLGFIKLQGAALVFARAFETWIKDSDDYQSAAMAVLDRELKRGETVLERCADFNRLTAPLRGIFNSFTMGAARRAKPARPPERGPETQAV